MAKTDYKSVDEYLASLPADVLPVIEKARTAIRKALPGAEEVISYQIAAYKLGGKAVIYLAGWKKHFSIYPASAMVLAELGDELSKYELEKGTIRFPLTGKVPATLIGRIAKIRAKESATAAKAPVRGKRKR